MKTLKELVGFQKLTGEDDLTIIKRWFIENDCEQDGLTIIPQLAQSKVEKIQQKYDYALSWTPNLVDMRTQIKDKEVADNLNFLQTCCTLSADLTRYTKTYEWAKENIPKMELPKVFFMPTIAYLQRYGIEFKISDSQRDHAKMAKKRWD